MRLISAQEGSETSYPIEIQSVENETSIGTGETVQSEGVPILLKKTPYLCLFPAPTLSQVFRIERLEPDKKVLCRFPAKLRGTRDPAMCLIRRMYL